KRSKRVATQVKNRASWPKDLLLVVVIRHYIECPPPGISTLTAKLISKLVTKTEQNNSVNSENKSSWKRYTPNITDKTCISINDRIIVLCLKLNWINGM
ncbi:28504_t:CDS:2, partial [Dentiscutata erythropus]